MSDARVLLIVYALLPTGAVAAEDWLGLDDALPATVALELTRDDSGDTGGALGIFAPLGGAAGLQGDYAVATVSDGDNEFDNWLLASRVWIELSDLLDLELMHIFEGNDNELEKETLGIGLNLHRGDWYFKLHLEDGDLLIFTRDELGDFFNVAFPDHFETGVSAAAVRFGWQSSAWYWELARQRFDYADDLEPLGRSAFAQFIVKSSALAHSSLLLTESTSLLIGHADFANDYAMLLWRDRAAIDATTSSTLTLSWRHWPVANLGYLLAVSVPGDDQFLGLTLGLQWVM